MVVLWSFLTFNVCLFAALVLWFVSACGFLLQDNRVKIVRSLDTVQVYNQQNQHIHEIADIRWAIRSPHLRVFFSLQVLGGVLQSLTEEAQKWRNGLGLGSAVASEDDGDMFFSGFLFGALSSFLTYKHGTLKLVWKVLLYLILTGFSLSRCPGSNRVPSTLYGCIMLP